MTVMQSASEWPGDIAIQRLENDTRTCRSSTENGDRPTHQLHQLTRMVLQNVQRSSLDLMKPPNQQMMWQPLCFCGVRQMKPIELHTSRTSSVCSPCSHSALPDLALVLHTCEMTVLTSTRRLTFVTKQEHYLLCHRTLIRC